MQSYLHCFINAFNKAINLRMSNRTQNELVIQLHHKRLPNLPTRQGYHSDAYNDLWNTMKSIALVSKDNHGFVSSGDFFTIRQK